MQLHIDDILGIEFFRRMAFFSIHETCAFITMRLFGGHPLTNFSGAIRFDSAERHKNIT
jgi:hypothetical protein